MQKEVIVKKVILYMNVSVKWWISRETRVSIQVYYKPIHVISFDTVDFTE